MTQAEIASLQNLIISSQQIAVLLPSNPSFDIVASATALDLALEKAGKKAYLVCETSLTVEYSSLFGVDKIKDLLPANEDLILRIDQNLVDKITRINAEGNTEKLELLIKPKEGIKITPEMVEISYTTMEVDLVITTGIKDLAAFAKASAAEGKYQSLLSGKTIVNVDNQEDNTNFGKFNFIDTKATALSELMVYFLKGMNLAPEPDLVTNLYAGIMQTTNNLQVENVSANTLEAVALCLRAGANKNLKIFDNENLKPAIDNQGSQTQEVIQSGVKVANSGNTISSDVPRDWLGPKVFNGTSAIATS